MATTDVTTTSLNDFTRDSWLGCGETWLTLAYKLFHRGGTQQRQQRSKAQDEAAREKTTQGARVQVPVYRQQRPEDSKIGTQSAAKSGRPE